MISICTWRWMTPGYRSTFSADSINALYIGCRRFYREPFRFVCFTDEPTGIDSDIEVVECPKQYADVVSPHGVRAPSCYRRLWLFSRDAERVLGKRFLSLDLDTVITGDLAPLINRPDEFVMWGDTSPNTAYNGSMLLHTAGTRERVWSTFDPARSPKITQQAKLTGSDQAWISYVLGKQEAKFTKADGVYSFRLHIERRQCEIPPGQPLPDNAKVIFFHGNADPWSADVRHRHPWIKQYHAVKPTTALVLGDGDSASSDLLTFRALDVDRSHIVALNDAGLSVAGIGDWLISDRHKLSTMLNERRARGLPPLKVVHSTTPRTLPNTTVHMIKQVYRTFPENAVAHALRNAHRVVLAGFPNVDLPPGMHSCVRAMSGPMADKLGSVTKEWLESFV